MPPANCSGWPTDSNCSSARFSISRVTSRRARSWRPLSENANRYRMPTASTVAPRIWPPPPRLNENLVQHVAGEARGDRQQQQRQDEDDGTAAAGRRCRSCPAGRRAIVITANTIAAISPAARSGVRFTSASRLSPEAYRWPRWRAGRRWARRPSRRWWDRCPRRSRGPCAARWCASTDSISVSDRSVRLETQRRQLGVRRVVAVLFHFLARVRQMLTSTRSPIPPPTPATVGQFVDRERLGELVEDAQLARAAGIGDGELDAMQRVADVEVAAGLAALAVHRQRMPTAACTRTGSPRCRKCRRSGSGHQALVDALRRRRYRTPGPASGRSRAYPDPAARRDGWLSSTLVVW